MINEYDRVILLNDLPEHRLKAGDVGTVVHLYTDGEACELEFFTLDGQTLDVVTVALSEVRPVGMMDILHARSL